MDDIPLSWQLGALAGLLLIGAFFSIAETSLMSLNRYRLRHLANAGHRGARLASGLLAKTDKLLGVILLGNNFANAASATLVTVISVRLFGDGQAVLAGGTLAVTFAILVFGEISPKVIAATYPEKLAFACSYFLYPLLKVAYPVVWFVNLFVSGFLKLLRIKTDFSDTAHAISMEELRTIVSESGKFIPKKHRSILLNLFDLEKATVDDVMTAHTQIEAVDFDAPLETILQQIATSHHTRMLVRQGPNEEIIGVIHIRKVMHQVQSGQLDLDLLREIVAEPYYVPCGTPLYTQLQQFQEKQQRLALVVDEYGELKGLVTLEDILEEIVGDFTTQSPSFGGAFHEQPDGSWLVDGGVQLRSLNRKLGLGFPLDGPKTLNGLVLEHFEDIPEPGTSFRIGGHTLEIIQTHERIVKSVRIYP
ncbi:MAG: HlyC/CorC family transporter [Methylophilaceae bacterium]|uniref:HlyC/CorC family transporter n=1 Tax=Methylobacillus sp. MM3 TaxID=1848039 RepID=UPI0007E1BF87|nr:HlyC/CorC family transporter [Methylobacillus sp. MM3]OAJ70304.1 magnesium and cobalt efflux protein CorC [Methylobacillus sp. MM3]